MASRLRSITARGRKWREQSSINPRQGKRGWSAMWAAGAWKPPGPGWTSCRKVSNPCNAPDTEDAWRFAPDGVTSNW